MSSDVEFDTEVWDLEGEQTDPSIELTALEVPGGGRIKDLTPPSPSELRTVEGVGGKKVQLHYLAAKAWEALVKAARAYGIKSPLLLPTSGYRSVEKQKQLWKEALKKHGTPENARKWVAPPGGSAHQTGRAIDFYLGGRNRSENVAALLTLPAYKWLTTNASRFGFYPYVREPWHWEYNPLSFPNAKQNVHSTSLNAQTKSGTSLYQQTQDSVRRGIMTAEVAFALGAGERNENNLTNVMFYSRHPELRNQNLARSDPKTQEWLHIRNNVIRPILAKISPSGPFMEQEHSRGLDEITQAGEVEHELNTVQGKTIYLPIRQDSTLLRKVGIFIPSSFQPSAAIDLIVYFHGHIVPACKTCPREFSKKGIEYYWNTPLFKCLREDLIASGQNAILVAPTFRPIFASKNNSPRDYGSLNEAGKFDILVNDTLAQLQKRGELSVSTQVRNIILSGHSGGGLPMKSILNARNTMKKNIAECWGFECLYFGTSAWESWLNANPNFHFRHFRRKTKFIAPVNALNKCANFIDVKDGTNHCSIVKEKWRQAIDGSSVLRGGGRSRELSVINREVSGLTSLLSGLPGLATLPFSFVTAMMGGFQDENHLTNLIFFARHPELGGRKLTASDPQSLKDEWMSILTTIIRPAMRRMREAGTTKSSAGSFPTMIPAKSISPVINSPEDSKFYLTELKLYDKKIQVASAGDKKKGTAVIIEEAPSIFLPEIIGMARDIALKEPNNSLVEKLDPTTWFKKFTRIDFLGRSLHKDQYVHLEMAKLLKVIDNELVKKYDGDAKSVGNMLLNNSNEGIAGSRLTSRTAIFSMHMFGLAVDVNYSGNPYIQSPNDIRALNTVLKNAALLMNEPVLDYKHDTKSNKRDPESNFDKVQQIDAMLVKYFSLLDRPDELSRYLQASSSSEWHRLSAADARARIQKHLDNLAGFLNRDKNYFKKHGILDFDKRFVLQMTKQGLDWGASYGDMMHFDMRSSGVGKYINLARLAYAKKAKDLAKRLFNEKRYGTHSP